MNRDPHHTNRLTILAPLLACVVVAAACSTNGKKASTGATTGANGAFTVNAARCPAGATKDLAKGAPIVIGSSLPKSGPAGTSAVLMNGVQAYFGKINAAGGIAGHKLRLTSLDDGFNPARAVANVKQLISQNNIFASILQVGSGSASATQPLFEQSCTPQLSTITTGPTFSDPLTHSWSTSAEMPDALQAKLWLRYLQKKYPKGANVGVLEWNVSFGQSALAALRKGAAGTNIKIVSVQQHSSTAATVNSQMTALQAAHPDALIADTGGAYCPMFVSSLARSGYRGSVMLSWICTDIAQYLKPLGDAATGDLVPISSIDPADAAMANDSGVKQMVTDVRQYSPGTNPHQQYVGEGYRLGAALVANLKDAAAHGGLSRVNLMNAVWRTNTVLPLSLNNRSTVINKGQANVISYGEVVQYNAKTATYEPTGAAASLTNG